MEAQSIKEYEHLEWYYWWFVGRRKIIERVLRRYFSGQKLNILDWGCGPGGNFKLLERYGRVLGVDASDESISACKQKGINTVVRADDLGQFNADENYDLVTNFDVLEHISEDEDFLRGVNKLLKPGGYILITVPAYRFLWGRLDEIVQHKRRYTRNELRQKLNHSGYRIVMASYFIFFLSPAFIAYRMFEKFMRVAPSSLSGSVVEFPKPINWLFTKIVALEAFIIPYISLPFGTSIIVLAKKRT